MATKQDEALLEVGREGEGAFPSDRMAAPKLVLALGRGKTGKSTFIRWAAETALERGAEPVIADADRTNATLAAFFENVTRPESPEDEDVRLWLNDFVDRQIDTRFSAFLDLGGGDLILKTWARDLELAPFLEHHGVVPVAVHFLGCDLDDLSYLRDIEESAGFRPRQTVIVLNEGLVPIGRVARTAFGPIIDHEVFRKVLDRGAVVARMPRLACMHEIERRRLSFADAEAGRVKAAQDRIGPVNRQLIAIWRREMASAFAKIGQWMP
jgi:hypothetical protein